MIAKTICHWARCDPRNWPNRPERGVLPLKRTFSDHLRGKRHHLLAPFRASCWHFGNCRSRGEKPATGWLCCEAAANVSHRLKFPDLRENTGNLRGETPSPPYEPIETRHLFGRIPCNPNREILVANRESRSANSEFMSASCPCRMELAPDQCAVLPLWIFLARE
jgi:hypothetical protein